MSDDLVQVPACASQVKACMREMREEIRKELGPHIAAIRTQLDELRAQGAVLQQQVHEIVVAVRIAANLDPGDPQSIREAAESNYRWTAREQGVVWMVRMAGAAIIGALGVVFVEIIRGRMMMFMLAISLLGGCTYVSADTPCGQWTVIDFRSRIVSPQARCVMADGTKIGAGADSATTDMQAVYDAVGVILGVAR